MISSGSVRQIESRFLQLTLAKPIELLVADSSGRGSYYPMVSAGLPLSMENQTIPIANSRLFCVDPREGVAVVEFAKPIRIGKANANDPRKTLCVASVDIDPTARPLIERLECKLQIDHDYVVKASLQSTGRKAVTEAEFHDLDFALALLHASAGGATPETEQNDSESKNGSGGTFATASGANVTQRSNVAILRSTYARAGDLWNLVPGDIVAIWQPNYFDVRNNAVTPRQRDERGFYVPCVRCGRLISEINANGPVESCRGQRCGQQQGA